MHPEKRNATIIKVIFIATLKLSIICPVITIIINKTQAVINQLANLSIFINLILNNRH